ncbi:hypothetical protein PsYK624_125250 [Phanerochaete sordida]|uniref:Uncharacterized protein n=1 Tax=Phanerochaete sordida TaxID=48140 RepID=A0A9P3GKA0_9APHY|nr:hypothetical protein PsYK624_125250 [Phanerochaete sordida]
MPPRWCLVVDVDTQATLRVNRLAEFDADPAAFMIAYENGKIELTADDLPVLLWDLDGLDLGNLEEGLMRGPLLLKAARAVYTGGLSAKNPLPGAEGGRRAPLITVYRAKLPVQKFTPEMAAYMAVLVRFSLSSQSCWTGREGSFCYETFYKNIVDLFQDPEKAWAKAALQWYQLWIYNRHNSPTFAPISNLHPAPPKEGSARALLLEHLSEQPSGQDEEE